MLYELNEIIQGEGLMEGEDLVEGPAAYREDKDKALKIRRDR